MTKTHLAMVTEARARAKKDNDIVYNEVVPSESSLPPIDKGKPVADPIPIHDVYATPDVQKIVGPDLFAKLVPLSVHESASLYSEEKAKLVRSEVERVELADEELASALEYMGLPASLARFQSGAAAQASLVDPGPQVRGWSDELRSAESSPAGRVTDLFSRVQQLKTRASTTLDRLSTRLDDESRACETARAKYGHLWEQPPSSAVPASRSFRQDVKAHRESLEAAERSDAQARALWEGVQRDVSALVAPSSEEVLERRFAEAVAAAGAGGGGGASLLDVDEEQGDAEERETKGRVEEVKEALVRLGKIKKERGEVLRDLKEKVRFLSLSFLSCSLPCFFPPLAVADSHPDATNRFKRTTSPTSSSSTGNPPPPSNPPSSQPNSRSSARTNNVSPKPSALNNPPSPK
jgi:tyrosine-protein phosphatase non-receptor type 23